MGTIDGELIHPIAPAIEICSDGGVARPYENKCLAGSQAHGCFKQRIFNDLLDRWRGRHYGVRNNQCDADIRDWISLPIATQTAIEATVHEHAIC